MLAGLSSLLPDGVLLSDVDRNLAHIEGSETTLEQEQVSAIGVSYMIEGDVKKLDGPVAILIGSKTSSAAERTVVAFQSRSNVKTFGSPTWGLLTVAVQDAFGPALVKVSVGYTVDSEGNIYGDEPIAPDVLSGHEESEQLALDWLSSQGCTKTSSL